MGRRRCRPRSEGTAPVQEEIIDQYRAVRNSRAWIPTVIRGTLQTRVYATVILRQVVDFLGTPDDVEAGVAARVERQQVPYEPGPSRSFTARTALRGIPGYRACPGGIGHVQYR
ncbi:Scr1 family TA system antitoxin-like transcriptional regulator [Streptomyces phytophilus]|uniref:Scr1 family TA system antitoxin-like transcriptional regulator n=1 Tax=Streptomyces phytophilus TaxID=722715 RepID=UPI002867C642|nr:Scr1 family TA system antitoxin-like transcriptional regulator [Streptomyces phytophilus]